MRDSQQDQQRKHHVFSILDDLKEKGERINADKVARIARMGKQTILPYYNEWRFMGALGNEQELELPDDLVRSLKRGIAKWKQQLSEEKDAFEEIANKEIDALEENSRQLLNKNEQLTNRYNELQQQNQRLAAELEAAKLEAEQRYHESRELKAQLQGEQKQIEQLQSAAKEQNALHLQALSSLEKQMDQRSQEQLNHWLSVVDDERRLKQGLEKKISKLNEDLQELKKAHLELHSRLDSKSKAYIQVCEDRDALYSERKQMAPITESVGQLVVLLDCEAKDLLSAVRKLQAQAGESLVIQQQHHAMRSENEKLEKRLAEAENRVTRLGALELELERARGAAEAFEKALPKLDNIAEVKQ